MQNDSTLWFRVEKEIATLLITRLENRQITPERAAEIAKFVIKSVPDQVTDQQMIEIIPKLDDRFTELSSLVFEHLAEVDETTRQQKLDDTRTQLTQYLQNKL